MNECLRRCCIASHIADAPLNVSTIALASDYDHHLQKPSTFDVWRGATRFSRSFSGRLEVPMAVWHCSQHLECGSYEKVHGEPSSGALQLEEEAAPSNRSNCFGPRPLMHFASTLPENTLQLSLERRFTPNKRLHFHGVTLQGESPFSVVNAPAALSGVCLLVPVRLLPPTLLRNGQLSPTTLSDTPCNEERQRQDAWIAFCFSAHILLCAPACHLQSHPLAPESGFFFWIPSEAFKEK